MHQRAGVAVRGTDVPAVRHRETGKEALINIVMSEVWMILKELWFDLHSAASGSAAPQNAFEPNPDWKTTINTPLPRVLVGL
jgi:hypothetical protein